MARLATGSREIWPENRYFIFALVFWPIDWPTGCPRPFFPHPILDIAGVQLVAEGYHHAGDIPQVFGLLAEAVIPQLVDDQIFRRVQVHFTKRRAQVDHPAPRKSRLPQSVTFPQRVQIGFIATIHVNGVDRDIRPGFEQVVEDDIGRHEHIPRFKLLRQAADRLHGDVDDHIQI